MDFLASLGLDELPEQQTRTVHLMDENPEFDLSLGFDACCTCGSKFSPSSLVTCSSCRRVKYCSETCRQQDAAVTVAATEAEGEEDKALGHTSVICSLLRLCDDDEAVEEQKEIDKLDSTALQASQDRVRSEYESYPATLANIISQGPCFQNVLKDCASRSARSLFVHIMGASEDAELWDIESDSERATATLWAAYGEALSELTESRGLDAIELYFIGPDCPKEDVHCSRPIQSVNKDRAVGNLVAQTYRGPYNTELLERHSIPKADVVVFFNPGFTVPEYDWKETLASIERGTPFLLTTNTELEGIADCQYLLDQDRIQTMPPGLADIFGLYSPGDDEDVPEEDSEPTDSGSSFFSENPYSGSRVRQSGTMANDLFVKNRWMLGGIMDSFDPSKAQSDGPSKRQKTIGSSNSKAGNPALV